jgi:hypothetical protein
MDSFSLQNRSKSVRAVFKLQNGFLKTLEPFLSQISRIAADIHIFNSLRPTSNNLEYDCTLG